jgi:trk system potassium uptake protein
MLLRFPVNLSPSRLLLLSVVGVIIVGTFLLSLPLAQTTSHSLLDLLFTATSATCVTGLLTVPLTEFTLFGKAVIMILIQIGGLGLITMTVFLISLFFRVGIKTHLIAGQLLELDNWKNSRRMITFIIALSLFVEIIGILLFYYIIPVGASSDPALFTACFHSISSFCCSGFSIFSEDMASFSHNSLFLITTLMLIIIGEMGFVTWHELYNTRHAFWNQQWFKLSLHTKIVLYTSSIIVITSFLALWFLEGAHRITFESPWYAFLNTIFNAFSYRGCGFSTFIIPNLQCGTFLLIMFVAFIGASPGSTGSGIKVTSVALIIATIKSVLSGRTVVDLRGRRIPNDQIFKVTALVTLALTWIFLSTFLLFLTEHNPRCTLLLLLFESVSAFSNLGISLGMTPLLSVAGKIIIIISMLFGRIGALTLLLAMKQQRELVEFQYPEERIMLS